MRPESADERHDDMLDFRLSRDLRHAAEVLTTGQARYLVDTYYQAQQHRIEAANQRDASESSGEPVEFVTWLAARLKALESAIRSALDRYSDQHAPGRWAKAQVGIGPVIAAGLLAHIDAGKARTAGAVWRFAGLDPSVKWDKGQKRPWNADLKVLAWKIGESFIKQQNHDDAIYARLIQSRKLVEIGRNEAGDFTAQAAEALAAKRWRNETQARAWLQGCYTPPITHELLALPLPKRQAFLTTRRGEPGSGMPMLPPAHIHARAKRWGVKLFLAHYHHVAYEVQHGAPPPKPYVISILGHGDYLAPPGWPMSHEDEGHHA